MKVERQRVGAFNAADERPMLLGKRCHSAKRTIHVEPHVVSPSHVGEVVEWINCAGADCSRVAYHADRPIPPTLVANDRRFEQTGIELKFSIDFKCPKRAFTEAEQIERFRYRIVRGRRSVNGK